MTEQLKKLITGLIEYTIDGTISWQRNQSIWNSETCFVYEFKSAEGDTRFQTEIKLDKMGQPISDVTLWIYNDNLTNGKKLLQYSDFPDLHKINLEIFKKEIKPNIVQKNEDSVFESILSNLPTKQKVRDSKIDDILENPKSENDNITENNGFFKRLFN